MCQKMSSQQRTQRSGVMDMILAIIGIVTAVADVKILNQQFSPDMTEATKTEVNSALMLLYLHIAISAVRFIMGLVLRKGATKKNGTLVRAWLFVSIILWLIQVAEFATKLAIGTFVIWSTISNSLTILIRVAVMYFVFKFIKEIQEERRPLLEPV